MNFSAAEPKLEKTNSTELVGFSILGAADRREPLHRFDVIGGFRTAARNLRGARGVLKMAHISSTSSRNAHPAAAATFGPRALSAYAAFALSIAFAGAVILGFIP